MLPSFFSDSQYPEINFEGDSFAGFPLFSFGRFCPHFAHKQKIQSDFFAVIFRKVSHSLHFSAPICDLKPNLFRIFLESVMVCSRVPFRPFFTNIRNTFLAEAFF